MQALCSEPDPQWTVASLDLSGQARLLPHANKIDKHHPRLERSQHPELGNGQPNGSTLRTPTSSTGASKCESNAFVQLTASKDRLVRLPGLAMAQTSPNSPLRLHARIRTVSSKLSTLAKASAAFGHSLLQSFTRQSRSPKKL